MSERGQTPKVWLWNGPEEPDEGEMLLVEDGEGNVYGIKFSGVLTHPEDAADLYSDTDKKGTPWRRIA